MKKHPLGLYVSPTEFVSFAESTPKALSKEIATRARRGDLGSFSMLLPNPDPVLKAQGKDIAIYRDLRAEPQVGGNIRRRKGAVKAMQWAISRGTGKQQASLRAFDLITQLFTDLDISRIISEILEAPLYGYQPIEVLWGKVGSFVLPLDAIGKPPEWFRFDKEGRLRFMSKEGGQDGELTPPKTFLLPRQDASYANPYGFPDLSMCFWPTIFKKGGLKFWVQFSEKYGSPWLVAKHPRNTTTNETDQLLDQMEQMIQDAIAAIPDDSSIEIIESASKSGSADVFERLLYFCRSEVNIALLGQNMTSEASTTRASAEAGIDVTNDIRDDDAALVVSTMNELIRWTCGRNFNEEARPVFEMWEQETVDKVQAERDESLSRAGARFTNQYFQRAYSLQEGDLADAAPAAKPANGDAGFAEESEADVPDQTIFDDAITALLASDAVAKAHAAMIMPLIASVKDGVLPETLLTELADRYPDMPHQTLQEILARAIFVAEAWGRLNGRN